MTHPEDGTLVPACVQHCVLDPVEMLPPVYCEGYFRSGPVDEGLDPVLHESLLIVVWFRDDLAPAAADFAATAVHGLPWDDLAEDFER